ncbi:hypothetical protein WA158_007658 [Blastocystis sp. Blastoise]
MSKVADNAALEEETVIELQGNGVPREAKGLIPGCTFFGTLPDCYSFKDAPKWESIDIHPSKYLIAGSTDQGEIAVFDYMTKSLIFKMSPQSYLAQTQYVNKVVTTSMDRLCPPLITPPKSLSDSLGNVLNVRFWDEDTLLWRTSCGRKTVPGNWIIALCDNGLFMIDYITRNVQEVTVSVYLYTIIHVCIYIYSHLNGNKPLCVEPISDQILAIGSSAGILLYNAVANKVMNVIPHKNVTTILSLPPPPQNAIPRPPYRDRLRFLSFDDNGYGCYWCIDDLPQFGIESEYKPTYFIGNNEMHNGRILSVDYDMDSGMLYSLGNDGTVSSWNLYPKSYIPAEKKDRSLTAFGINECIPVVNSYTYQDTFKMTSITCPLIGVLPEIYIPCIDGSGKIRLINTKDKTEETKQNKVNVLCDTRASKPNLPIKSKVTMLKRQDTNNSVIACSTSCGIIVFTLSFPTSPSLLLFPPSYSKQDNSSPITIITAEKQNIVTRSVSIKEESVEDGHRSYPIASLAAAKNLNIAEKSALEKPQFYLSFDEKRVCIYYSKTKAYKICNITMNNGIPELTMIHNGKCLSFAWSIQSSQFAILTPPAKGTPTHVEFFNEGQDGKFVSKSIYINTESEPFALYSGPLLTICVRPTNTEKKIHRLQTSHSIFYSWELHEPKIEGTEVTPSSPTPIGSPTLPTPGTAIPGVTPTTPAGPVVGGGTPIPGMEGAAAPAKVKNTLPYIKAVGNRLPSPLNVIWSADLKYMAMIYKDKTALFMSEPNIHLLSTLPFSAISIYWYFNTVFLTTANSIYIGFISKDNSISSFVLSTRSVSQINQLNLSELYTPPNMSQSTCPLRPPIQLMPSSPLYILGIEKGHLLVTTPSKEVCLFPLDHPSLRIYMLLGCNNINMCMKWAEKLDEKQHDSLAVLLQQYGYLDECLKLKGLSPSLRLTLQLNKEDIHSIIGYIKKKDLKAFDDSDAIQIDTKLTPVEPLSGLRRAGVLLAKKDKKNELKALIQMCLEDDRLDDAIFLASFLYSTEPSLLTDLLKQAERFNEASLACQVNMKLKKELATTEQLWNTQLDDLGKKYSYLSGIQIESSVKEDKTEKKKKRQTGRGAAGESKKSAESGTGTEEKKEGKEGGRAGRRRRERKR